MGRSGTRAHAVYALLSHFWYVGGFGDLGDPVVPTLRGDNICLLEYKRTFFAFSSLAEGRLMPVRKTQMSVSTNNGLVNGLVHNLPLQFFTLDSSKSKFLKIIFLILSSPQMPIQGM